MNSEKNLKKQRKAFSNIVRNLIYFSTSNPFCGKEVSITLPDIPNMNEENIQPVLKEILGYIPKILLFQRTEVPLKNSTNTDIVVDNIPLKQVSTIPVVLLVIELK